ncbi:hypothetical protein L6164_031381 [Bauhinia variegata]|uniref:Uncharacterized protein n=1 Tax=Bauhinia variegata TaxID=167791 RepID=A0ACB9LFQ9_BAUVA|nr:hypothetical protein L6164_031381 [Bauhinia variegata]
MLCMSNIVSPCTTLARWLSKRFCLRSTKARPCVLEPIKVLQKNEENAGVRLDGVLANSEWLNTFLQKLKETKIGLQGSNNL